MKKWLNGDGLYSFVEGKSRTFAVTDVQQVKSVMLSNCRCNIPLILTRFRLMYLDKESLK